MRCLVSYIRPGWRREWVSERESKCAAESTGPVLTSRLLTDCLYFRYLQTGCRSTEKARRVKSRRGPALPPPPRHTTLARVRACVVRHDNRRRDAPIVTYSYVYSLWYIVSRPIICKPNICCKRFTNLQQKNKLDRPRRIIRVFEYILIQCGWQRGASLTLRFFSSHFNANYNPVIINSNANYKSV